MGMGSWEVRIILCKICLSLREAKHVILNVVEKYFSFEVGCKVARKWTRGKGGGNLVDVTLFSRT